MQKQPQGEPWLVIQRYVSSKDFHVLLGSVKNYKEVVVKFGSWEAMEHEYNLTKIAHEHRTPNFTPFLCMFRCNDRVSDIQRRDFCVENFLCGNPSTIVPPLGVVLMPYYSFGCLEKFRWDRTNVHVLKNVMHQTVFAVLNAYEAFGFVHGDLHVGNVLVRSTKKKEIAYAHAPHPLQVQGGLYAIVMDFDKSNMASPKSRASAYFSVYRDIDRFLQQVQNMENSDVVLECDVRPLTRWLLENTPIDAHVYHTLYEMIASMSIRYVKSEPSTPPCRI